MDPETTSDFVGRLTTAFHDGDSQAAHKQLERYNVERLMQFYAAVARHDFSAAAAFLADNVSLEILGAIPFAGEWNGRDQVSAAIQANFALVDEQQPEIQSVTAQGDTVVVVARELGLYKPTARRYDVHWVQIITFAGGKIVRAREIADNAIGPDGPAWS